MQNLWGKPEIAVWSLHRRLPKHTILPKHSKDILVPSAAQRNYRLHQQLQVLDTEGQPLHTPKQMPHHHPHQNMKLS